MSNTAILYLLLFHLITQIQSKIHFAFNMFRHGARAPFIGLTPEGKDCYGYTWPGLSEMSDVGLRMHYLLGVRNRKRYVKSTPFDNKLLSPSFTQTEILVMSTDVNRTLISASAQLQGLYPPSTGPTLTETQRKAAFPPNKETNFTPIDTELQSFALPNQMDLIPIHAFYPKDHTFQLHDRKNCPALEEKYQATLKRKEVKEFIAKIKAKYGKVLAEIQKAPDDSFLDDYWETYKYMDTFIVDRTNGRAITELTDRGVDPIVFEELALEFLYLDYYGTNFADTDLAKVSMTHTGRNVIAWMERIMNWTPSKPTTPKFVMYSAHDTTIGAFEIFNHFAFGTDKVDYAPFAANGQYELYTKTDAESDREFYVRYIYNDKVKFDVSFKTFKETIEKNIWSDAKIAEFCQWEKKEDDDKDKDKDKDKERSMRHWMIATIVTGVITGILIGVVVYMIYTKEKEKLGISNGA